MTSMASYKAPIIRGFNQIKLYSNEYMWKARQIAKVKPSVLFLGSSRTERGIDPNYYSLISGGAAFNAGLVASDIEVQMNYLKYAKMVDPNLEKVFIGLDFEAFNEYGFPVNLYSEKRLRSATMSSDDLIVTLFSLKSLKDSFRVIKASSLEQELLDDFLLLEDGSMDERRAYKLSEQSLQEGGKNPYFDHLRDYLEDINIYKNYSLKNYSMSQNKLGRLRMLIDYCRNNGLELTVFIHPSHALQWEGIKVTGRWEEFEAWKKEVVKTTQVWDFSGYNSVTTAPTDNFEHYWDQSHYRKQVGNLVLNRMLGVYEDSVPKDFGYLMTQENIEQHLLRIRKEKKAWEENNPEIVNRIERLAAP